MIDWNKLQPYKTTKQKSFEQLCYEIAVRLHNQWHFTPIDDSGGGDGVEFYVTLDDGTEWGWQAKYYEGSVRLNISNRQQQIINSLKRAIVVHPKLVKWFLCVPMDFTPGEQTWFETELIKHIPADRQITLIPWNESFLHEKINLPELNGLKQAFFNNLELSQQWFRQAFENSFAIVKNKFDELLYTTNEEFEYWYLHPILCDDKFISARIAYYPRKLAELQKQGLNELQNLKYSNTKWRPFFNEYIRQYSAFNQAIETLMPVIQERITLITPNSILTLKEKDFDDQLNYFSSIKPQLVAFRQQWTKDNLQSETDEDKKKDTEELRRIWPVERVYDEFIEELRYYADHSCIPVRWRIAHYLGGGGAGKTNFCIAVAKQYLDLGLPAIYIPAIKFTSSNPLSEQILSLLDIKTGYSLTDFLDTIDALGKIYNKRIPIIIDGLNEALSNNGFLNERLELDLPGIENEINARSNVVLLTTCRNSYQKAIWGTINADDRRFHDMYGFTGAEDKKRLVNNYFDHYKIQSDLSFMSLERFTKPLYLKIFCETVNPSKEQLVEVTLGYDSIYSIFDSFVKLCNDKVYQRLSKAGLVGPTQDNKSIASRVLKKIAKHLWENPKRAFLISDLMELADGTRNPVYKDSITKALLEEELLLIRNWQGGEEFVYLTYDVMAGYFIAEHLMGTQTDFSSFFHGHAAQLLLTENHENLHPNYEDILNGLCSLLPIKKGIFVHDIIEQPDRDFTPDEHRLFEKSLATTIMLSPQYIPADQVAYFSDLADIQSNLIYMFGLSMDVLFVTGHPFNFSFWGAKLRALPMNQLDVTWTEKIRYMGEDFLENTINEFETLQQKPSLSDEQIGKIDLVADFLVWTFTSTNTNLKKKSANALYLFAIKFPAIFFKKYYNSAEINDPTIFEWMSNVLYNAIIHITKSSKANHLPELISLSKFIDQEVLQSGGKFAGNHLITRNYNFNILSLLVKKVDGVDTNINLRAVKKSFSTFGVIDWKTANDKNAKKYRDGNALTAYDFHKEKMPYIMLGKGNEYNQTPAYKKTLAKLRWRAYQLGYDFDLFGEIDKTIANRKHWGGDYATTDRYADKYIEIAYLEYCGYLDAKNLLKDYEDYGYLRTFKLKHDPTQVRDEDESVIPDERFPVEDYIDTTVSLQTWCTNHSVPDVKHFIRKNQFLNKQGDWVLLRSLIHQNKPAAERQLFFLIDTVFVKNKHLDAARKAFTNKTELGRANDSIPYTNHIHYSEIPDAEAIPYNDFIKWHYSLKSKLVTRDYTEVTLSKDGKILKPKEADKAWNSVLKQLNYLTSPRISLANFKMPFIRFTSSDQDEPEEDYEAIFKRMGIDIGEQTITKREKQAIDRTIEVFIPTRYLKQQAYLCKNMIDELRLSSPIGTTDLFDAKEEIASFSYKYEVSYSEQESFVYLRRDLLNKYLKDNGLTMFSIIWGERDYFPEDDNWMHNPRTQYRKWAPFYEAVEYQINTGPDDHGLFP